MDYGIDIWGNENFIIKNGKVCINYEKKPAIIDIVKELRDDGYKGPLLLRFPHLIQNKLKIFTEISIKQERNLAIKEDLTLFIL